MDLFSNFKEIRSISNEKFYISSKNLSIVYEMPFSSLGIPTNIKKILLNIYPFKTKSTNLFVSSCSISLDMKVKIVQSLAISFTSTPPCHLYQYKRICNLTVYKYLAFRLNDDKRTPLQCFIHHHHHHHNTTTRTFANESLTTPQCYETR